MCIRDRIYSGVTTPTEAAAIAASYALILAFVVYRTLKPARLLDVMGETVKATACLLYTSRCV